MAYPPTRIDPTLGDDLRQAFRGEHIGEIYNFAAERLQEFRICPGEDTRIIDANCRVGTDINSRGTAPSPHIMANAVLCGVLGYSSTSPEDLYKFLGKLGVGDLRAIAMVMVQKKLQLRPGELSSDMARRVRWGGFSYPSDSAGRLAYFTAAEILRTSAELFPRAFDSTILPILDTPANSKVLPSVTDLARMWDRL